MTVCIYHLPSGGSLLFVVTHEYLAYCRERGIDYRNVFLEGHI